MESQSPAEELPGLYRGILDGIAQLEAIGERREAARVRSAATAVYSSSWNDDGRKRLRQLQGRIDRIVAGSGRPRTERGRGWRLFQRTVPVR
jgi:hypothetical protein